MVFANFKNRETPPTESFVLTAGYGIVDADENDKNERFQYVNIFGGAHVYCLYVVVLMTVVFRRRSTAESGPTERNFKQTNG